MNILIYFYIFIMGITFGSFFTLAVYRIPKGEDIIHTRSYCPKCNHKLSFLDMIPLFSYMFLGGKCRYCKEKIRPRYFLLEFFSGIVFVLFALSINFGLETFSLDIIIYFIIGLLYIAGLFIIAGIDKEKIQIQNEIIIYLTIVEAVYIIYLCIIEKTSIYRYVIYLLILAILTIIDMIKYKKKIKNNYVVECLILLVLMNMFTYEYCTILTVILTLISISINLIISKIARGKYLKKENESKLPVGFYLSISNIIILIVTNFMIFR